MLAVIIYASHRDAQACKCHTYLIDISTLHVISHSHYLMLKGRGGGGGGTAGREGCEVSDTNSRLLFNSMTSLDIFKETLGDFKLR